MYANCLKQLNTVKYTTTLWKLWLVREDGVGGGGQPIHDGEELAHTRGANLYFLDKNAKIRFSHENQDVMKLYSDFLEKPLSHKSHMLLHTDHTKWEMPR